MQFGFREGFSTIDAGFVLSVLIQNARARKLKYKAIFIDIQKVCISIITQPKPLSF